jgi:hypothetical protein
VWITRIPDISIVTTKSVVLSPKFRTLSFSSTKSVVLITKIPNSGHYHFHSSKCVVWITNFVYQKCSVVLCLIAQIPDITIFTNKSVVLCSVDHQNSGHHHFHYQMCSVGYQNCAHYLFPHLFLYQKCSVDHQIIFSSIKDVVLVSKCGVVPFLFTNCVV